ncbi:hypothetical protein CYLTODRAFT_392105 [Cylindrobasidium torrendii FP15055 ss-10]|uniref:Uncharacterized protein n=1 Tax=Cylindrobasidium torrendii FP15055 ss-10 TaxID=1314674 RepID=A0A0D7BJQ9_9AGAR|nr:hypothetical protein CYLTODRAFT_392105 [Cylindrobasidium torrendii FP15055 ss-10]
MATYTINFDLDGQWDLSRQAGPAIHAPNIVRAIAVTKYRIEWLDMAEADIDFFSKNHMIGVAVFENPQTLGGKVYQSARISMEIDSDATSNDTCPGVLAELRCGEHYSPGVFTLMLQQYDAVTHRAGHSRTYSLAKNTTIGDLINPIISRNMHHFAFLTYTKDDHFKGCGHFIMHSWYVYLKLGLVSECSVEDPNTMLSEELTYTYFRDEIEKKVKKTFARVGKGKFLVYDEGEPNEYIPEEMWSSATPKHHKFLSGADDNE